ncbi:MAG TPA: PASTA domain-containing protein [Candidatus Krumholzibacteria bacterium]|nr:PASTA domain-containing protein [Candidatus Krumholzibacteria bacterium]
MKARGVLIRILVLAGLFFAGIYAFNYILMPMLVRQSSAVIVPDLRNTSEAEAKDMLSRIGLTMRVERSDYDSQIPAGFILSQQPDANENLKPGRSVVVVVSLGTRIRMVPEIRGMSLRQCRSVLQSEGLQVGRVARVQHIGDAREHVVASSPPVGDEVHEGESVDVVLSVPGGATVYVMPDLTSQDLFFVREKLEKLGFRVGSVRYEDRDGVFPNTIIDQRPRPGEQIREGESIELVASSSR